MSKFILIVLTLLYFIPAIHSQNVPDTDIFVYRLEETQGKITLSQGENVTNQTGYDNQPYFHTPQSLLYVSQQPDGQMDVLLLDLASKERQNLTQSGENEFSPVLMPGSGSFAAVRVEPDGKQRLWSFTIDKSTPPQLIFDDLTPVGYHAWSSMHVATFFIGETINLVLTDIQAGKHETITENIGRTLKIIPGTEDFAFEKTEETGEKAIYQLSVNGHSLKKIIEKPDNSGDWAITMQGTYLTSTGSRLMKFNPNHDETWTELIDLGAVGEKGITRMAVSRDNQKLALVINQ